MTGPNVVGLDLSITATGAVYGDGIAATWTTRSSDGDRRLEAIAAITRSTCAAADLVVIEGPVVRSSAAVIIGMVHGAVRLTLLDLHVPYALVTPATLKKFATGKGNAGKPEMAVALYKRAGLELGDDNQVDAAWLRIAGLFHLGLSPFPLPAGQVEALAKVAWPLVDGRV